MRFSEIAVGGCSATVTEVFCPFPWNSSHVFLPQVGTLNFEVQVCLPHTRKVTVSEAEGDLLSNRSTVFNRVVLKSETFVVEAETRGGILQWLTMQVLMLEFLLDHRWWC